MNKISAIIPVHNSGRYLRETIASMLAQTCPPHELIVVDNASTDDSAAIAKSLGTRIVCEPRKGEAYARNRGLAAMTGEFVAFLDADDLWTPRKLELQLAAFAAQPALEAVYGCTENFVSPELPAEEAAKLLCTGNAWAAQTPGAGLIRRMVFDRVGSFSSERPIGVVVDWFARAQQAGLHFLVQKEIVLRRRLHTSNTTRQLRARHRDYLYVLKQKLDRERAVRTA